MKGIDRSAGDEAGAVVQLQKIVGRVLRAGAVLSTALMTIGLVLKLAGTDAAAGDGPLRIGLIILMATPVANVIVSGLEYATERDWKFVLLTVVVLLILSGSLVLAFLQR